MTSIFILLVKDPWYVVATSRSFWTKCCHILTIFWGLVAYKKVKDFLLKNLITIIGQILDKS